MGHTTGEKSTAQTLDDHQMQDAATRGQPNAYLAEMGRRGQADELRGATPRSGQAGDLRDMGRRGQSEELRRSSQETVARQGIAGSGGRLPHADRIQRAFGRHDVGGIQAHTDDRAAAASDALGARGYAIEGQVAFAGAPDLHTAAHEAAHVIQGGGGVHMKGSGPRDAHEDHADAVADAVVRGESAEGLLDAGPGASGATAKGVRLQEANADTAQEQAPVVTEEQPQPQTQTAPSGDPTPAQLAARQSALANLTEFERQVERHFRSWRVAARNVGSAYELAGDRHTKAIEKANREQALTDAIMFGILTAASAGTLSWLSTVVQGQRASAGVLFNALEDATQAGAGEGIDAYQGAVAPSATPVAAGPLGYQNSLLNHLDELMNNVSTHFSGVQRGMMGQSWGFWDSFDPSAQASAHAAWMSSSPLSRPPEVPSTEAMADSLEVDMWASWAPQLHSTSIVESPCMGTTREIDEYSSPGSAVEQRLTALGITAAAGIGDFGIWTSSAEIRALIAWAGTHQPRRLLDL